MASAYTKRLWTKLPGIGSGPWTSPGPAAGLTWILRDITAINATTTLQGIGCYPLQFRINSLQVLGTPIFASVNNVSYRWRDVRLAVINGDSFQATSSDQYWSFYVTGYELSA